MDDESTQPGSYIPVHAYLKMGDGTALRQRARKITFYLTSSSVPGESNNRPLQGAPSGSIEPDLQFPFFENSELEIQVSAPNIAATVDGNTYTEAMALVASYDWGAYGDVMAEATLEDGSIVSAQISGAGDKLLLPRRQFDSHVADSWKEMRQATAKPDSYDDDISTNGNGDSVRGDGLSLYEEYRGFSVDGQHLDTDPLHMDYFVANLIGDGADDGIQSFQKASGLTVQKGFRPGVDFNVADRVINFNVGPKEAHVVAQHLVLLTQGTRNALVFGAGGYVSTSVTYGGPNTPGGIQKIVIDGNLVDTPPKFTNAVVHEMGHSVNIAHHGEDDAKKRVWTANAGSVTELGFGSITPIDDTTGQAISDLVYGVPVGSVQVSSAPGGPASGDEQCFMRYTSMIARAWQWGGTNPGWTPPIPPDARYVTDVTERDLTGTRFCSGQVGFTFNAFGSSPPSRWGSATKGDCAHQIRVNDKYRQ